jgi:ABC-type nitrate/sulfonate/bicarbonate transport system substrate-binding protein
MDKTRISRRTLVGSAGAAASLLAMPAVVRGQGLTKINVVSTQGLAGLAIQDISVKEGFWKEQGLDVTYLNVSDASKTIASLLGGSNDLCQWSGMGGVPAAIEKGGKLKIVAGALMFPTHAIYSAKPDIKQVKDLVGKTIGVGALGAQLHQVMLAILIKKGIDPAQVTFRNVGSNTDVFRAIAAGIVDAGPSDAYALDDADKYNVHALTDGNLWIEVPEFIFQAGYASDDAIAKNRPLLVKALAVFAKSYRFVQSPNSLDSWKESFMRLSGKNDPKEAESQWNFIQKYKPYAVDLVLTPESMEFMQKLNVDLEVQKKVLPFDQVADMSLAKDALKLI